MIDPKRLLDDLGHGSEGGSLLRAMRPAQPPSLEKEAELVRLMFAPIAAAPLAVAGVAAKTWAGVGAAVVASGLAATWLWLPADPMPAVRPPHVAATLPTLAPRPAQELSPVLPAARAVLPVNPPSSLPSKANARDTLAEEEALLERARRALGSSPGTALTLLRQHQRLFPSGQLTAERMFLTIDALRRAGDRAGAERQIQGLLKRFPTSVYAGQLRSQVAP